MSRNFTIVSTTLQDGTVIDHTGGKFVSSIPYNAAKKAFNKACKSVPNCQSLVITLRETTAGSLKKEYKYNVTRELNENKIIIGGKEVTFKYTTKVKAL
jgi:hypothetical protein